MALEIQGVSDLYAGLSPEEKSYVLNVMQGQLPPNVAAGATEAVSKLGPSAMVAVAGLQSGNTVTAIEDTLPLISGALMLGGPAGMAAGGVVALGGTVFGMLADSLGWGKQTVDVCTWIVGGVCFRKERPYGPSDPKWLHMQDFANTTLAMNGEWHSHNDVAVIGHVRNWADYAFPWDFTWIGSELNALGDKTSPAVTAPSGGIPMIPFPNPWKGTPQGDFLIAFYRAVVHAWEFGINGYSVPDLYGVLQAVKDAWNKSHSASKTYTFMPKGTYGDTSSIGKELWIEWLLAGGVDGKSKPPATINIGPKVVKVKVPHVTPAAKKVAAVRAAYRAPAPVVAAPVPKKHGWLVYLPAAIGVVAFPVTGPLGVMIGAAGTVLWIEAKHKGWHLPKL